MLELLTDEEAMQNFSDWRDRMQRKHRTMTQAEYSGWCKAGDIISSPCSSCAFPGGLTVTYGPGSDILGKVDGFEPPPAMPWRLEKNTNNV